MTRLIQTTKRNRKATRIEPATEAPQPSRPSSSMPHSHNGQWGTGFDSELSGVPHSKGSVPPAVKLPRFTSKQSTGPSDPSPGTSKPSAGPSKNLFTQAINGITRLGKRPSTNRQDDPLPSKRLRPNRIPMPNSSQMKIRGQASKGKTKAIDHTIDLTSDNEAHVQVGAADDLITGFSDEDVPKNQCNIVSQHMPRQNAEDMGDDPLAIPQKTKPVNKQQHRASLLTQERTYSEATRVQPRHSPPLHKSSSVKKSLKIPLKKIYVMDEAEGMRRVRLPLEYSYFLLASDRSITVHQLDGFEWMIDPERIDEIHLSDVSSHESARIVMFGNSMVLNSRSRFEDIREELATWAYLDKAKPVPNLTPPDRHAVFLEIEPKYEGVGNLYAILNRLRKTKPSSPMRHGKAACPLWDQYIPKDDRKYWRRGEEPKSATAPQLLSPADSRQILLVPRVPGVHNRAMTIKIPRPTRLAKAPSAFMVSEPIDSTHERIAEIPIEQSVSQKPSKRLRMDGEPHNVDKVQVSGGPTTRAAARTTTLVKSKATGPLTLTSTSTAPPQLHVDENARLFDSRPDSDVILVWPFDNEKSVNSVAITLGDLKRLEEGEFLNDTLIEFGLKWELEELRKKNASTYESIHLFNSFFFQKLNKKSKSKSPIEDSKLAYEGVRKWTKGHDLFKKDYIVIPINEHMHWYFMIVANPGSILHAKAPVMNAPLRFTKPLRSTRSRTADNQSLENPRESAGADSSSGPTVKSGQQEVSTTSHYFEPINGQKVAEPNIEVSMASSTTALDELTLENSHSPVLESLPTVDDDIMQAPCVLTLDSLCNTRRAQAKTVMRYLVNEANDKLDKGLPDAAADIATIRKVEVPEQPNYCDCGLYLIHAFKTFFENPLKMMEWIRVNEKRKKKSDDYRWKLEVCEKWDAEGAKVARKTLKERILENIPQYEAAARLVKEKKDKSRKEEKKPKDDGKSKQHACDQSADPRDAPELKTKIQADQAAALDLEVANAWLYGLPDDPLPSPGYESDHDITILPASLPDRRKKAIQACAAQTGSFVDPISLVVGSKVSTTPTRTHRSPATRLPLADVIPLNSSGTLVSKKDLLPTKRRRTSPDAEDHIGGDPNPLHPHRVVSADTSVEVDSEIDEDESRSLQHPRTPPDPTEISAVTRLNGPAPLAPDKEIHTPPRESCSPLNIPPPLNQIRMESAELDGEPMVDTDFVGLEQTEFSTAEFLTTAVNDSKRRESSELTSLSPLESEPELLLSPQLISTSVKSPPSRPSAFTPINVRTSIRGAASRKVAKLDYSELCSSSSRKPNPMSSTSQVGYVSPGTSSNLKTSDPAPRRGTPNSSTPARIKSGGQVVSSHQMSNMLDPVTTTGLLGNPIRVDD